MYCRQEVFFLGKSYKELSCFLFDSVSENLDELRSPQLRSTGRKWTQVFREKINQKKKWDVFTSDAGSAPRLELFYGQAGVKQVDNSRIISQLFLWHGVYSLVGKLSIWVGVYMCLWILEMERERDSLKGKEEIEANN